MFSSPFFPEEFEVEHPFLSQGIERICHRVLWWNRSRQVHLSHPKREGCLGEWVLAPGARPLGHVHWLSSAPLSPFASALPFLPTGG